MGTRERAAARRLLRRGRRWRWTCRAPRPSRRSRRPSSRAATARRSTSSYGRCSRTTDGSETASEARPGRRSPSRRTPCPSARRRRSRARGRPRGTCRARRSGRTCAASCARPSSAATCGRAARTRAPSRSAPCRPKPGSTPARPGNCTDVASSSVSGATSVGASSSRPSASRSSSGPRYPHAGEPCSAPARPSGSTTDARKYSANGIAGALGDERRRELDAAVRVDAPPRRAACSGGPSSGGRPGRVREQMAQRRALGAGRLVEVDRPLLDRDEHREPGQELRDRRPAQRRRRAGRARRRSPSARTTPAAAVRAPHVVDRRAAPPRRAILGAMERRARPVGVAASRDGRLLARGASTAARPRRRHGADHARTTSIRRRTPYEQMRSAASRSSSRRSREAGAAPSTSSARASTSCDAADWEDVDARARRGLRRRPAGVRRPRRRGLLDERWLVEIEVEARRPVKQIYPAVDHRQGQPLRRGRQRARPRVRQERPVHARRRGGVHAARRRDVRPRAAHRHRARRRLRARARAAHQPRADAVGARGRDAGVPHAGRRRRAAARRCAAIVCERRARARHARRLGGHASVLALRAAAHHREGPLPRAWSTGCSTSRGAS